MGYYPPVPQIEGGTRYNEENSGIFDAPYQLAYRLQLSYRGHPK